MNDNVKEAMRILSAAIKSDPEYAWSWHCNIAMAARDEGLTHKAANLAAARFMYSAFGVDTLESEQYKSLFPESAEGEG